MAADFFTVCARFYYHLLRLLRFNDLHYNETLKRVEHQHRNPRTRYYILCIYYSITGIYATFLLAFIMFAMIFCAPNSEELKPIEVISYAYILIIRTVYVVTFFIVSYQVHSKQTNKFLKNFFNELFVIHRKLSALTGCRAVMETHNKLLLLFKIILIVGIVFVPAQRISVMSNLMSFPVFELAYIANYAIIIKLLTLHKVLKKWIKLQEEQYTVKTQCSAKCKTKHKPMRKAISLWRKSGQMLTNFLKYFNWYEKLVLLQNIYCVYLSSQFIVCVFYRQYYNGALLPDSLNHIINMLLIGMVNDTLRYEEDALNDILTALIVKLSPQRRLCRHCSELLKAIDLHLCCRHMHPERVSIFGNYWTRGFVIGVIQNLVLLGFNMTQFGSEVGYLCNYDPETSPILIFT